MARRKLTYPEKPHVMAPEIARRFQELIDKGKKKKTPTEPKSGWLLYRLDNLEDADQGFHSD